MSVRNDTNLLQVINIPKLIQKIFLKKPHLLHVLATLYKISKKCSTKKYIFNKVKNKKINH